MRKARFEVDAIRASGVTSALWSDEEVIDAANTAMDRAARLIRLAGSNILTKFMKSTDSSVDLVTEVYSPSSFKMTESVIDYTLPPDFVRLESIVPTTDGYDGIRFHPASLTQKGWIDQSVLTASDVSTIAGSEQIFYYTIIGARTLRIRPIVTSTFDVEILYQYRPAKLLDYSTGTIKLTTNSTTAHGVGVTWVTSGIQVPAELHVHLVDTDHTVNLSSVYPRISAIISETDATLSRAWPSEPYSGAYHISTVPQLPEEHHAWLAQVTAAIMLRKVSPDLSKAALEDLDKQLSLEVQPEIAIRQVQESLPVDEYTLP